MSGRSSGRGGGCTASQLESLQEESGESDQSTGIYRKQKSGD